MYDPEVNLCIIKTVARLKWTVVISRSAILLGRASK
jgi:hypothetical protein